MREVNEAQIRKLILITIAGYGDADGTNCRASAETIAFDTGCGMRCISDHKAALIAAGYISRDSRRNNTDDCTVHIPEHVWTEVQMKSKAHKEMMAARASRGGWGRPRRTQVDAAYAVKVDAAYAADDLSITSSITSSLPFAPNATPKENKQDSLKDDGPKQVHGQKKPIEDFKLRVSKLSANKILFTSAQVITLKEVLSEFTSDELFMGFRLAWDEMDDDQIQYMASKFTENAYVQAQQGKDALRKKAAEKAAIDKKTQEMQDEAAAEREANRLKREAEEALIEEELPA